MDLTTYASMIKNLLPQGFAWPRETGTDQSKLIDAFAVECQRVDKRVADMIRESHPLTSSELLSDWERETGLPEKCEGAPTTIQGRRKAVDRKLSTIGGQSNGFYIETAARIGYEITITEFQPFRVGENAAGDPILAEDWANAFQVNSALDTINYFRAGEGAADEPLAYWGNELLECVISRIKPAHMHVLFAYAD